MLWPFFEGNQRSIKSIAAYWVVSLSLYKVMFQVQGHVSCAEHGFIPPWSCIKWRPEAHFISANDVHFIESYTWGMLGPLLDVETMKKCTPLWCEAHVQVKMHKEKQVRTSFGSWDDEKVHAVVARSTCPSQNVQNTPVGPLLEVEMMKKCTPLWREAHVQVKMYKAHHARTTFGNCDVEKVHAGVARSTFRSQKCKSW